MIYFSEQQRFKQIFAGATTRDECFRGVPIKNLGVDIRAEMPRKRSTALDSDEEEGGGGLDSEEEDDFKAPPTDILQAGKLQLTPVTPRKKIIKPSPRVTNIPRTPPPSTPPPKLPSPSPSSTSPAFSRIAKGAPQTREGRREEDDVLMDMRAFKHPNTR